MGYFVCIADMRMFANGPAPFNFETDGRNCSIEWRNWLRGFEIYARLNKIKKGKDKRDWLLHFAGPKVQNVFFSLPDEGNKSDDAYMDGSPPLKKRVYDEAVAKLETFFAPKQNPRFERHVFRKLKQENNERIDMFILRLRTQAEKCNFNDQLEENIKDQITAGCNSELLRRKILERGEDKFDDIIKLARVLETVAEQQKTFNRVVKENDKIESSDICKIESRFISKQKTLGNRNFGIECSRCGYRRHKSSDAHCPAMGKACNKCSGKNHFVRKCMSSTPKRKFDSEPNRKTESKWKKPRIENSAVQSIEQENVEPIDDYDDVFYFEAGDSSNRLWCKVGGVDVNVIVDSGTKFNIVDRETWIDLKSKGIQTSMRKKEVDRNFDAYGKYRLKIMGMFEAIIETPTQSRRATFYVADEYGKFLVGSETAQQLNILKIGYDVNAIQATTTSTEFNKMTGIMVDIPIRSDVKPIAQPYRRIPAPLEKKVNEMVGDLLSRGIIEPVQGASKWISPLVPVPKSSGDLRICVDMRRANEAVDRENHPLPTMEDFLPHLGNATVFSKLDVEQAYHQVGEK